MDLGLDIKIHSVEDSMHEVVHDYIVIETDQGNINLSYPLQGDVEYEMSIYGLRALENPHIRPFVKVRDNFKDWYANLDSTILSAFQAAAELRAGNGLESDFAIAEISWGFIHEYGTYLSSLDIVVPPTEEEDDFIDYMANLGRIQSFLQAVVNNKDSREIFIDYCGTQCPDGSYYAVNRGIFSKLIERTGWSKVLDVGTGQGHYAKDSTIDGKSTTVGLERQRHWKWYKHNWNNQNGTSFVQADMLEMPFAGNHFDLLRFEYVAHHITTETVNKFLQEALRVTREGGGLIVGPQYKHDNHFSSYRLFIKQDGEFIEQDLYQFLKTVES
jgi:2-polyprenyl-3-methyl-5-hydroxy-6-metoxy-1,4-benzoquinol methylase